MAKQALQCFLSENYIDSEENNKLLSELEELENETLKWYTYIFNLW